MPHLFELLQKREINVVEEYDRLIDLFNNQKIGYTSFTTQVMIDDYMFRELKIRQSFLDVDDLFSNLELNQKYGTLDELLLLIETISTILYQSESHLKKIPSTYLNYFNKRKKEITDNMIYVVEKCNYELKLIDNYYWALEKNPLTSQAIEFIEDEVVALETIEYNHYLLKGDLDAKRKILNQLGHFIEPLIKSKLLGNNEYKKLESDAGFYLNNFNIRHNNLEGVNKQQICFDIANQNNLEDWYDKAYNTILMCIVAEKQIKYNNELKELKKLYGM